MHLEVHLEARKSYLNANIGAHIKVNVVAPI